MTNPLNIEISSRAMYSSWCWHKPTRSLFDAGDGLCPHFLSRIFGVERVMLSHHDADHTNSLFSLIGLRAKTKGDTGKKLDVYFPEDNFRFNLIRDYVSKAWRNLPYELTWHPINPGFELKLSGAHSIKAFDMAHQRNGTTLGYKLTETRTKLLPEFVGQDIGALLRGGKPKSEIHQSYVANTFAYTLDAVKIDPSHIENTDFVVFDGTFLSADDRDDLSHFCWEEVFELAKTAKIKRFLLAHISTRYSNEQIQEAAAYFHDRYPEAIFQVCYPSGVLAL